MEKIILPNGMRILLDTLPWARSCAVTLWVGAGSAFETPEQAGISHLMEHMVFKGSEKYSALDIAAKMDQIGVQLNAFTTKENTCYYFRSITEHVPAAFDVLADMVLRPTLTQENLELEKSVVLEEIGMYEDMPEELVGDKLFETVWPESPLGRSVSGYRETVAAVTREELVRFGRQFYHPGNMVLSVSGNFDREGLLRQIQETFGTLPEGDFIPSCPDVDYRRQDSFVKKDIEQTHIVLGFPGPKLQDPDRYAISVFGVLCGESNSSRLFQRIREELGLVYSVYSFSTAHRPGGVFAVAAAVNPENASTYLEEVLGVLQELKKEVKEEEFVRAKENLKASFLLGLEGYNARASFFGRRELIEGQVASEDEVIAAIEAVTQEQVQTVARRLLDFGAVSVSVVARKKVALPAGWKEKPAK